MSENCKTGKEWGEWARQNGARTVEPWKKEDDSNVFVAACNDRAVVFPAGELKPHASLHIGRILKWMLLGAVALILALAGTSGPLAGLILKLVGGG